VQEKQPQSGLVDPVQVVNVMEIVAERFARGQSTPMREISDQTRVPEALVARIVERLVRAGMVHRVEGVESSVALAAPPEQISGERLLDIGYALVDEGGGGRVSSLVARLREAQRRLAGETTLAAVVPTIEAKPAS
jgi:DNA-binding IscR family transcriptional regulator